MAKKKTAKKKAAKKKTAKTKAVKKKAAPPASRTGKPSSGLAKGASKKQIGSKDQKILWARAAGLCSICREKLTFVEDADAAGTLGEMCHIVGEKTSAARGKSLLLLSQRNTYTNLILLCANHHKEIDKRVSKYPIELLHKIKDDHERWVTENLASSMDPDDMVYSDLIDTITVTLQLEHWLCFVDNAVRDLVPFEVANAQGFLNLKRLNAIWPKKRKGLKTAITDLIDSFDKYISHYMSNAEDRGNGKWLGPDHSYRRFKNPNFYEYEQKEDMWSNVNFWLLCNYIIKLNCFANAVRKYMNPMYFRIEGRFIIHDSMGHRFGGMDTLYDPTEEEVKQGLQKLKYKLG